MSNKLKVLFKIIISVGFMWFALTRVDFAALGGVFARANVALVAWSFVFSLTGTLIMVCRWEILLKIFSKKLSFFELVPVYWVGLFFNLFLPSAVGGDAVKIYKLAKKHGHAVEFTTSVLMDRIIGLVSLTLLALINILVFKSPVNIKAAENIIYILSFILFSFFVFIFSSRIVKKLTFARRILSFLKLEKIVKNFYLSFNLYRDHLGSLFGAAAVSLTANVIVAFSFYFLALAVGTDVPLIFFFIVTPVIFLITVLPISISGLGLQDGAYIFFLGQIGISPTVAFSISILSHFIRYLTGLIGGAFFMLERDRSQG